MNTLSKLLSSGVISLTTALSPIASLAATPADTLVVANRIDDIITIDPAESFEFAGSDVSRNIYQKLVNFDPFNLDAGYQPEIAESWTVSSDGRSITFQIRDGLTFASGNPLRRLAKINLPFMCGEAGCSSILREIRPA